MAKCTFCGKKIPLGTGKIYVKKDGRVSYFCSSKCEKNMIKFKKKPHETRWTKSFHELKNTGSKTKQEVKSETKQKSEEKKQETKK